MNYFFDPAIFQIHQTLTLSPEESRHASKVLRLAKGDAITILNGKGEKAAGDILAMDDKGMQVHILEVYTEPRPDFTLSIALAVLKKRERLEWFVEKAIELAADRIILFQADHTEKFVKADPDRIYRIAVTALKQSGNLWLPDLVINTSFKELILATQTGQNFIAHCYDGEKTALGKVCKPGESMTVLIGPEGDFSVKEVETALKHNFTPVSLGNLRLRAETAALYALMTMRLANQ